MDLGTGTYKGMVGGLYGAGSNEPPAAHAATGLQAASRVVPRSRTGAPSSTGRVVLISIGMSNTTMEFRAFQELVRNDGRVSPSLTVVDGAQGGVTAADWADRANAAWSELDRRLKAAGVTRAQVQVAWVKMANRAESTPVDTYRAQLEQDWITTLRNLRDRFPNLQIAYQTSRIYAGYASTMLNPEPYAYESGFVVKRIIQRQIAGQLPIQPWLAWGPYLWADGLVPRSDGLTWQCSDFNSDGTHPSASGRRKVAERLLEFFESDDTATWFLR
jgi:lysophospholipase L1-like esterase